jgi:hypothetical protein
MGREGCSCQEVLTNIGGWFLKTDPPTAFETSWNCAFQYYKDGLISTMNKWWTQEDKWGKSCIQYDWFQFYLTLYLVTLIKVEWDRGLETDWQYYIDKYGLEEKAKFLACFGINLTVILNCFDLPPDTPTPEITYGSIDYEDALANIGTLRCNNLLNDC